MLAKRPISGPGTGSPDPATSDLALVEQVKAGQTQKYGELVRRYQDRVFNACWRICGHLEDARDLTQEAFLKAFESLGSFRQESGFYTWVFRVATNLAISNRRSAGRRRAMLDGKAGLARSQAEALARRHDAELNTGQSESDEGARVAALLQTLDDDQRTIVVLRDIEGLDYQQIAAILGVPAGTVKSRLHRARMTLREGLKSTASVSKGT